MVKPPTPDGGDGRVLGPSAKWGVWLHTQGESLVDILSLSAPPP